MLFRFSQEVLIVINIDNSLMQDNVEEGIASNIKEVPHKILETISWPYTVDLNTKFTCKLINFACISLLTLLW